MPSKIDYLDAKRTVDDRALDRRVWNRFLAALEADGADEVRIVEVGAGIGSMVARLADRASLPARVSYRAVDRDPECIAAARERLPGWLEAAGYDVGGRDDRIVATDDADGTRLEVAFETADALALADDADAVVAAAFLDLVDLERALSRLSTLLRDGGVLYAPCTFDGKTAFAPAHPLDDRVERLYHRHMDEVREQPGSSRAGRDLLEAAPAAGFDVCAVGGMDWVISPRNGEYPAAEATVLAHLLETIDGAVADYPASTLAPADRERWVETRRRQLEAGELVAVVHHLDVLARR